MKALFLLFFFAPFASANQQLVTHVDGPYMQEELTRVLTQWESTGTTPARVNHRHVYIPCAVSLVSEGGRMFVQLTTRNSKHQFALEGNALREQLTFDGANAWQQLNYYPEQSAASRRFSLSAFDQSAVVMIDSAKCALPKRK